MSSTAAAPAPAASESTSRSVKGFSARLEAFALSWLKVKWTGARVLGERDAVHVLNPHERAALRVLERRATTNAALIGAGTAALTAVVSVLALPLVHGDPMTAAHDELIRYYALVLGVSGVAAAVEVFMVFRNGLWTVREIAATTGAEIFEGDDGEGYALALARAALEIPNPPNSAFGIDPHRDSSRLRLIAAAIVYKAKVGLTNLALRFLIARVAGRAALRSYIPLIAVPVTAAWDAIVCRRVIREARLRAIGPSLATELRDLVYAQDGDTAASRELAARAVACAVVRTRDFHPNHATLLRTLCPLAELREIDELDSAAKYLGALRDGDEATRRVGVRALIAAVIVDGGVARRELALLRAAARWSQLDVNFKKLEILRRGVVNGDDNLEENFAATWTLATPSTAAAALARNVEE